jgi:hypothetical protein
VERNGILHVRIGSTSEEFKARVNYDGPCKGDGWATGSGMDYRGGEVLVKGLVSI